MADQHIISAVSDGADIFLVKTEAVLIQRLYTDSDFAGRTVISGHSVLVKKEIPFFCIFPSFCAERFIISRLARSPIESTSLDIHFSVFRRKVIIDKSIGSHKENKIRFCSLALCGHAAELIHLFIIRHVESIVRISGTVSG